MKIDTIFIIGFIISLVLMATSVVGRGYITTSNVVIMLADIIGLIVAIRRKG